MDGGDLEGHLGVELEECVGLVGDADRDARDRDQRLGARDHADLRGSPLVVVDDPIDLLVAAQAQRDDDVVIGVVGAEVARVQDAVIALEDAARLEHPRVALAQGAVFAEQAQALLHAGRVVGVVLGVVFDVVLVVVGGTGEVTLRPDAHGDHVRGVVRRANAVQDALLEIGEDSDRFLGGDVARQPADLGVEALELGALLVVQLVLELPREVDEGAERGRHVTLGEQDVVLHAHDEANRVRVGRGPAEIAGRVADALVGFAADAEVELGFRRTLTSDGCSAGAHQDGHHEE